MHIWGVLIASLINFYLNIVGAIMIIINKRAFLPRIWKVMMKFKETALTHFTLNFLFPQGARNLWIQLLSIFNHLISRACDVIAGVIAKLQNLICMVVHKTWLATNFLEIRRLEKSLITFGFWIRQNIAVLNVFNRVFLLLPILETFIC